jgi:hypothetical protein
LKCTITVDCILNFICKECLKCVVLQLILIVLTIPQLHRRGHWQSAGPSDRGEDGGDLPLDIRVRREDAAGSLISFFSWMIFFQVLLKSIV